MTYSDRQNSRYSQKPVRLYLFYGSDNFGPFAYTDSESAITRSGQTYTPWVISSNDITQSGTLDKTDTTISLALGSALDAEYMGYPPSQVVNISVFEGTEGDDPTTTNFPAIWVGRVTGASPAGRELKINAIPAIATMRRIALRRNYQLTCPHALYGPKCQASEVAATVSKSVLDVTGPRATVNTPLADRLKFHGGMLKWTNAAGRAEVRTILSVSDSGSVITVRGHLTTLAAGTAVSVVKGCNRIWNEDCTLVHNNVVNFGGQPFIPLENPMSTKNQFF